MKGWPKKYKTKSLGIGLLGSCAGDGARFKEHAGKYARTKQGGENGVENRGVFARSWYFGSV